MCRKVSKSAIYKEKLDFLRKIWYNLTKIGGENMSLTNSYLITTKNLEAVINAVLTARAPERFTYKFLEDLGFKSSNDRL